MHKLPGLDHLRALAIILVFLFHYQAFGHPDWEPSVGAFDWIGVDLFFVLSGFLIAGQLFNSIRLNKPIGYREFFIKRVFRIIPAFLVIVLLYFLFPALRERPPLAPIWRYLTFTVNFGLDLSEVGTFTHAWSLCIEEQFYLVLPFVLLVFHRQWNLKSGVGILFVLFIGGFVIRAWNWNHFIAPHLDEENVGIQWYKYIYYPTYCRLDGLIVGVSLAGAYEFLPTFKRKVEQIGPWLFVIGIGLLISDYLITTDHFSMVTSVFGFPILALAFGCIVAGAVSPKNRLFNRSSSITTTIATLSYGIYLIHKMTIHVSQNLLANLGLERDGNLMMILCMAASVVAALLLRLMIERPFLLIREKVLAERKP